MDSINPLTQAQVADKLNEQVIGFARYARENRFQVGVQELLDCHSVATQIGVINKPKLRFALKSLMCSNNSDWERFDRMFDLYWRADKPHQSSLSSTGGAGARSKESAAEQQAPKSGAAVSADVPDGEGLSENDTQDGRLSQAGASAGESLHNKNFKHINQAAELREMEELAERLAKTIRRRLLRRLKINQKGRRVDLRHSMRRSLQYGGEVMELSYRKRKVQIPKLVLLLDVSRSMSIYNYLFLRFARGILSAFDGSEAFAFHTRLQNIGEVLREPSRINLVEKMELISYGWGGGTRLDQSLYEFNQRYAHRILNNKTIFLVVSDGYDTGKPEELVKQLQRVKQRARKLVWVNPLLGQENYEPSTQSMQAVLPMLDVFAPGHNLQSLSELEHPFAHC